MRKIVSEIHSPPQATKPIKNLRSKHLMPGFAFDLTVMNDDSTPWDFTDEKKRVKARARVREQKPYMLIGSSMCKDFGTWQRLSTAKSKDPKAMRRAKIASIIHSDFVAVLYKEQMDAGRYFLHTIRCTPHRGEYRASSV